MADIPNMDDLLNQLEEQCRKERQVRKPEAPFSKAKPPDPQKTEVDDISLIYQNGDSFRSINGEQSNEIASNGHHVEEVMECEANVKVDLRLTAPQNSDNVEVVETTQKSIPMVCNNFATCSFDVRAVDSNSINGFNEPDIVQIEEKSENDVVEVEKPANTESSSSSSSDTEDPTASTSTLDESYPQPVAVATNVVTAQSEGSESDDEASSSCVPALDTEENEDLPALPEDADVNDLIEGDLDAQLAELEAELLEKGLIKESEVRNHADTADFAAVNSANEKNVNISEQQPISEGSEETAEEDSVRSLEGSTNEEKMLELRDVEETIAVEEEASGERSDAETPPSPPPSPKNDNGDLTTDVDALPISLAPEASSSFIPPIERVEENLAEKLNAEPKEQADSKVSKPDGTKVSNITDREGEANEFCDAEIFEEKFSSSTELSAEIVPESPQDLFMSAEVDETKPQSSEEVAAEEQPTVAAETIEDNVFVEENEPPAPSVSGEATEDPVCGPQRSVILSTHAVGNVGTDLRLTESELQLGKSKPVWIRDEDCKKCMICTSRFTLVNRRHHCRCCGRVLCAECCSLRRLLPYMTDGKKQRVCVPCNSTLDRIELYEKTMESMRDDAQTASTTDAQPSTSTTASATASTTLRKKSVLKQRPRSDASDTDSPQRLAEFILGRHTSLADSIDSGDQSETPPISVVPRRDQQGRRSVKFLDGVSPGDEHIVSPPRSVAGASRGNRSKLSSRRSRAIVGVEEGLDLTSHCLYTCANPSAAQLSPLSDAEFASRLTNGYPVRLCLTRNIHLLVHLIEYGERWVYALYTDGFNTVGVEELLLVFERCPAQVSTPPQHICRAFFRFIELSLQPSTDLLDDRMGIRQCASRMSSLFELSKEECEGHQDIAAVLFHPYHHQDLTGIPHPSRTFRVGLFVRHSELPFVEAMSTRFVHRLGMLANKFPAPILNEYDRPTTFEAFADASELSAATILSMFHDFRTKTYQLNRVAGSTALISERTTRICLPDWTAQQVKSIVDSNTNLLGWACDLSTEADAVLVCERVQSSFASRVFSKDNSREKIGAAFVAFSTGHKGPENDFTPTLVEDGVVVRLHSDSMELLQKRLSNGENFFIETAEHSLEVVWIPGDLITAHGAIPSPVDGIDLRGYYQYGLLLNRALNSNSAFLFDKTFALRLGTVVHLHPQRMDRQHRSKFFDACEQFAVWLKTPLEQWAATLLAMDIHEVCVRLHLSQTNFDYLVAPWIGLEEAHAEFSICVGEKLMPFLAYMTSSSAVDFFVELHLPIVSIRPISSASTPIPPPSTSNYAPVESQPVESSETEEPPLTETEPPAADQV